MNLASVNPQLLLDCISSVARETGTTEQQVVDALASRYTGVVEAYRAAQSSLLRLPRELITESLAQMTPRAIAMLGRTSTSLYRLTREPELWRGPIQRDWGVDYSGDDPLDEYQLLYDAYFAYYRVPEVLRKLKTVLSGRLPDTEFAQPLRDTVMSSTLCEIDYETKLRVQSLDLATDAIVPGLIRAVALIVTYPVGADELYKAWNSPWCSFQDAQLWLNHTEGNGIKLFVAEQFPVAQGYSCSLTTRGSATQSTIRLLLAKSFSEPETPTPRGKYLMENIPRLARRIKESLFLLGEAPSKQGSKWKALVSSHHRFWCNTQQQPNIYTGGTRGAVYDDRDDSLDIAPDDTVTRLTFQVEYSCITLDSGSKIEPECRSRDDAALFQTRWSPFTRGLGHRDIAPAIKLYIGINEVGLTVKADLVVGRYSSVIHVAVS